MLIYEMFVELPAEKITPDTLSTQLELNSIGFSELRLLCEHKFQIKIPDEDATHDNVHTLAPKGRHGCRFEGGFAFGSFFTRSGRGVVHLFRRNRSDLAHAVAQRIGGLVVIRLLEHTRAKL